MLRDGRDIVTIWEEFRKRGSSQGEWKEQTIIMEESRNTGFTVMEDRRKVTDKDVEKI